jgi:hypothetical protein
VTEALVVSVSALYTVATVLAKSGKDSSKIKGKLGVIKLQVGMNTPDPEDPP